MSVRRRPPIRTLTLSHSPAAQRAAAAGRFKRNQGRRRRDGANRARATGARGRRYRNRHRHVAQGGAGAGILDQGAGQYRRQAASGVALDRRALAVDGAGHRRRSSPSLRSRAKHNSFSDAGWDRTCAAQIRVGNKIVCAVPTRQTPRCNFAHPTGRVNKRCDIPPATARCAR
jgi:hypothetical protein